VNQCDRPDKNQLSIYTRLVDDPADIQRGDRQRYFILWNSRPIKVFTNTQRYLTLPLIPSQEGSPVNISLLGGFSSQALILQPFRNEIALRRSPSGHINPDWFQI